MLLPALAGCRQTPFTYPTPPPAENRLPFKAIVWELEDGTPDWDHKASKSDLDGADILETSLTRDGSSWRPALDMETLSRALAAEVGAKVTESAAAAPDPSHLRVTFEYEAQGVRLFLQGKVVEARWVRGRQGGGEYRLKVELSATLEQRNMPDFNDFWRKTEEAKVPHRGRADEELAEAARRMFADAAEDLARAMTKEPAKSALEPQGASAEQAN